MAICYNISSKEAYRQGIIKALGNRALTYQELAVMLAKNGLCNTSLYWYLSRLKSDGKITSQIRHNGVVGRPQIEYRLNETI